MKKTIDDKREEIENKKKSLIKKENEIIDKIYNLKDIMLNEENHVDNLINKELKVKKRREYINIFEELLKAKTLITERDRLKTSLYDERKELVKLQKKFDLNEKERIKKNTEIEELRKQILDKTCQFVKENGMIEQGIKELENLKKQNLNV